MGAAGLVWVFVKFTWKTEWVACAKLRPFLGIKMSKCKNCDSYAINPNADGRDNTDLDLCDVCYWRKRAEIYKEFCIELTGFCEPIIPYTPEFNNFLERVSKLL